MTVRERLETLGDAKNADFLARLTPGIAREAILGVRMGALRALAKELRGTPEAAAFLASTPHGTLDENTLHALLLNEERDYDALLAGLDAFLPHVDNWVVCDALRPKAVRRHPEDFERAIEGYLASGKPYTQRFGMEMLMAYYLDEGFRPGQLALVGDLRSEHYYVRMMQAWYFATALAKQPQSALPWIEQRRLAPWTHRKTIQKAVESFRIDDETKAYLRTLR